MGPSKGKQYVSDMFWASYDNLSFICVQLQDISALSLVWIHWHIIGCHQHNNWSLLNASIMLAWLIWSLGHSPIDTRPAHTWISCACLPVLYVNLVRCSTGCQFVLISIVAIQYQLSLLMWLCVQIPALILITCLHPCQQCSVLSNSLHKSAHPTPWMNLIYLGFLLEIKKHFWIVSHLNFPRK